jgi:aspartyl-tRNA(Asn)/glutamyl-tRNA(Gln) amidotransferase subunit A
LLSKKRDMNKKKEIDEERKNIIIAGNFPQRGKWELTYAVKDNFWTKLFPTTASSKFLMNFFPGQDATVIKTLEKKGYKLLGKTALDEFACGGLGLYAVTGPLFNPYHSSHIVGGSSSGAAVAVAKNMVPWALGHDTGDSVRRPAAYCGIVGFKPSYGLISRLGVIPMASSLDTIGILAKKVGEVRKVFSTLAHPDLTDLITITPKPKNSLPSKRKKIAIVAGLENNLPPQLAHLYHATCQLLENSEYQLYPVVIPKKIRDHLQLTYLILCSTELVSHLNSLQGITYGTNENIDIAKKRSKYLGKIVKERLLIGNYFLSEPELLIKAQKIRYLVNQWIRRIFRDYNFLIFPSTNDKAPRVDDFTNNFSGLLSAHWSDNLLLLANLSGIPSLSLPIGFIDNLPVSLNINSAYGNDELVLELATILKTSLTR